MPSLKLRALCLVATAAISTGIFAQTIYKCGDSYSQLPCPGAVLVDAVDARTSDQKRQADLATGRIARTADAMEKARIKQAQTDLAANTPPAKTVSADKPGTSSSKLAKKKNGTKYLSALVRAEKKKAQTVKKSADKMDASKP